MRNQGRTSGDLKLPGGRLFAAWFVFCAVIGLAMIGVGIWAVITLVHHFAG